MQAHLGYNEIDYNLSSVKIYFQIKCSNFFRNIRYSILGIYYIFKSIKLNVCVVYNYTVYQKEPSLCPIILYATRDRHHYSILKLYNITVF